MTLICAPVCLFAYNRADLLNKTLQHLMQNYFVENTDLYIFSDASKSHFHDTSVLEVRSLIKKIPSHIFKSITIIEREKNIGLAASIIDGVTNILEKYNKVIVLEDDLITSKNFLKYMNEALNMYENFENVASVHAWTYPLTNTDVETYFLRGADCWGWGTWKRAWKYFEHDSNKLLLELDKKKLTKQFDLNGGYPFAKMLKLQTQGKVNSWAIRWHASIFLKNMLTLYPSKSLVQNIGFASEHSTHTTGVDETGIYTMPINIDHKINLTIIDCKEDFKKRGEIIQLLKKHNRIFFLKRIKRKLGL